jgi:hypothetical protein
MDDLGTFLFKLMILGLISPTWYPFLRAVWEEMNISMAEEGGLFGPFPSRIQLEEIMREKRLRADPLVHEPFMTRERQRAGRREMRTRSAPAQQPAAGAGRRSGF